MRTLRGIIYRLGGRPRLGSIWHSPSLSWRYAFKDADVAGAMRDAINRAGRP